MTISPPTKSRQLIGLIVSFAICFGFAAIGSAATSSNLNEWFSQLNKPTWNPPNWIFAPVWSLLYAMMAIAAWLVWRVGGWSENKTALTVFGIQLTLNMLWSILFFGLKNPGLAIVDILLLWIAIACTIWLFAERSKLASSLLLPYLAWVSFATILNVTIWLMNR